MTKRLTPPMFTILALGLGIAVLVIFTDTKPSPEPFLCNGRPCNIILIIPESLSARHMGIYGYERDTTPFIDEFFSEESIVFENAWSTAPWTIPSFAALFTSQLAPDVFVERWQDKLCDTIPTFIDVLSKNKTPKLLAHTWTILPHKNISLVNRFEPDERFVGKDPFLFLKATEWIEKQVQRDDKQPFFLLLQPFAPHSPYDPPEPYRYFFDAPSEYPGLVTDEELLEVGHRLWVGEDVKTEKIERFRLQYDQEIRYLDSMFESFIARIPEEVIQNTIFIFTSDHGEAFGQHDNLLHTGVPYEEVIHVPFLIRASGIDQQRIQDPISLLDAGPTILDVFGFRSLATFQGTSLLTAMRGEGLQLEDRIVRAEELHYERPPRAEWLNIEPRVRSGPLPYPRSITVRKGNWKLLQRGDGSLELYNLERDYYEQDNLILRGRDLSRETQEEVWAEVFSLFKAVDKNFLFPRVVQSGDWKLMRCIGGQLELYNLKQDPEQQNNLLNDDGIPQWHFLSREEQLEVTPLFKELGEEPPFVKIK